MEHITDPVFGTLESNSTRWIGSVFLPAFDQRFRVGVPGTPDQPPGEPEREAFRTFLGHQHVWKAGFERAVLADYTANLEQYRSWYEDDDEGPELPDLHSPQEIWSQVFPSGFINLDYGPDDRVMISITFGVSWDEEHGLEVTFYDNKMGIEAAGTNWVNQTHYDLEGRRLA